MIDNIPDDPLNPSDEEVLFEKLSQSDHDFNNLQFIRRMMKKIVESENIQFKE